MAKKKKAAKKPVKKIRVNEVGTGRLIWITPRQVKAYERKKQAHAKKLFEAERERLSEIFDKPLSQIESLQPYDNANTSARIKAIVNNDPNKRLRYKGRYISKDAQEKILQSAEILDKQGIEYTLNDLLKVPEISSKILIVKSKTAKQIFYWNMQNLIYSNLEYPRANHKRSFDKAKFVIKDFDGSEVYAGTDAVHASEILLKANRKIEALTKVISELEGTDPYFTVDMYDETRDGEFYRITIDLSGIQGRISEDTFNKYKSML